MAKLQHHDRFALVYRGLICDPKHADAMGFRAFRVFLYLLTLRGASEGEVECSAREIAAEMELDERNVRRALQSLLELGYLTDRGERTRGVRILGIRRPWKEQSRRPESTRSAGQIDPEPRVESTRSAGQIDPDIRNREERPQKTETPKPPEGALRAPGESAYSNTCPVPSWIVLEWISWANPGVDVELFEMQQLHKALPRLTASWNTYPRPELWKRLFRLRPGVDRDVRAGTKDVTALLARCAAEAQGSLPPKPRPVERTCSVEKCAYPAKHQHEGVRFCSWHAMHFADQRSVRVEDLFPNFDAECGRRRAQNGAAQAVPPLARPRARAYDEQP